MRPSRSVATPAPTEVAQIDEQHCDRAGSAVGSGEGAFEAVGEQRPIGQPSQRIFVGELLHALAQGGDVWVEVSLEPGAVGDSCAVVRVRDTGIGIPAQDADRIFSSFFRARNVGPIPGTGIGLAGARQIVEQHAGRLTVASCEGSGTTFTLRLPLEE